MRSVALLLAFVLAVHVAAAPQTAKPAQTTLPLSYVCVMAGDEDVIEDHPGTCRKCGMTLVPIRLDSVWTCATRPLLVVERKPGKCPVDGTPLVQVTAAVSWTCKNVPAIDALEPGTCPDGSAMIRKYAARAHGNHNPQHGGQFFMAPDNWHHLEGALPRAGVVRVYFYDDYTKPLPAADFRKLKGRIITEQTFDAATRTTKEMTAFPLVAVPGGKYYEAKIGKTTFPAQITARVRFKADGPEYPFDFTFTAYSKEPVAAGAPRVTSAAPAPELPVPAPETPGIASNLDPALVPLPVPDTVPEMLAQLRTRTAQIRDLIDRGSFGSIYVPAFQAKDLALALDAHTHELSEERRRVAGPAIAKLVRSAWLLDAFGDIGNKQQISEAYARFVEAAKDILASFPEQP